MEDAQRAQEAQGARASQAPAGARVATRRGAAWSLVALLGLAAICAPAQAGPPAPDTPADTPATLDEDALGRRQCEALARVVTTHAALALLEPALPYQPADVRPLRARAQRPWALERGHDPDPSALKPLSSPDGRLAAIWHQGAVWVVEASAQGQLKVAATWPLPQLERGALSLQGGALAVVGMGQATSAWGPQGDATRALHVLTYDARQPARVALRAHWELDGQLVGAHHDGRDLYVIWLAHGPQRAGRALARGVEPGQVRALIPSPVPAELGRRWSALYDRRTFEERQRALDALRTPLARQVDVTLPSSILQRRALIGQRGAVLDQALGCVDIHGAELNDPTGLLVVSHVGAEGVMRHEGILVPLVAQAAQQVVTRQSADALYIAWPATGSSWLLQKPELRALQAPTTRLLKLERSPKTGRALMRAQIALAGAVQGPQSLAVHRQDVKLFLSGPSPRHVTLVEHSARRLMEVASQLEPVKPQEPIFAVEQGEQRLYLAYGQPVRLAAYDLRDAEQPRKLAEIALPSAPDAILSASASILALRLPAAPSGAGLWMSRWEDPRAPQAAMAARDAASALASLGQAQAASLRAAWARLSAPSSPSVDVAGAWRWDGQRVWLEAQDGRPGEPLSLK